MARNELLSNYFLVLNLFVRHALEHSLERALAPSLAAVISFVDVRANLQLLNSGSPLKALWLKIFTNCEKFGLSFDNIVKWSRSKQAVRTNYIQSEFFCYLQIESALWLL